MSEISKILFILNESSLNNNKISTMVCRVSPIIQRCHNIEIPINDMIELLTNIFYSLKIGNEIMKLMNYLS